MKKTPRERQIDQILENIKFNWYIVKEQRLGQFLANYVFGHHTDPFYWQDEKLLNKESVGGKNNVCDRGCVNGNNKVGKKTSSKNYTANYKPTTRKFKQNTKLSLDKKKAI